MSAVQGLQDEGYHTAETTVHFKGNAGQSTAVASIHPDALAGLYGTGNVDIAQPTHATVTKVDSEGLKGMPLSLSFYDGDNNEIKGTEQGGFIVTDGGTVQNIHVPLHSVTENNPWTHTFKSQADRPIADIKASRETGIAKLKYNPEHKPEHGVQVLESAGAPDQYICKHNDGSPLSTIVENNPQMAAKDPKTGKPKVHTIDGVAHHVLQKKQYDECMDVLEKHLNQNSTELSKGVKLSFRAHGKTPPKRDWSSAVHIKWGRPDFGTKPALPGARNRSTAPPPAVALKNASAVTGAYTVKPVEPRSK